MRPHRPELGDYLVDARKHANALRVDLCEKRDRWHHHPLGAVLTASRDGVIAEADARVAAIERVMAEDELGCWSLGGGIGLVRLLGRGA